jgi:hypothetical protein
MLPRSFVRSLSPRQVSSSHKPGAPVTGRLARSRRWRSRLVRIFRADGILWCGCVVISLAGCSRSTTIVEHGSRTEESRPALVSRGQEPSEETQAEKASCAFPQDAGGILLAKLLAPAETEGIPTRETVQRRVKQQTGNLDLPPLPLPMSPAAHLPMVPTKQPPISIQPRLVVEETLDSWPTPVLPEMQLRPSGPRLKGASVESKEPAPLPILAQPVTERAPLDDATGEASTQAALAAPPPARTAKAPFLKLSVPDPFEFRKPVSAETNEEQPEPPLASPRLPKP